jgi:hypothetical protein
MPPPFGSGLGQATDPGWCVTVKLVGAGGAFRTDGAALTAMVGLTAAGVAAGVTTGVGAGVAGAGAVVLVLEVQAAISIVRTARQAAERRIDPTLTNPPIL